MSSKDVSMLDIKLSDVKVFYDAHGQAQEVLISYEAFRRIQALLEQLRNDPEQGYFWSEDWQARIREGEADVHAGRTFDMSSENIDEALEWL